MSILLIGPSGIGKNTAINASLRLISEYKRVPIIAGKTTESIESELANYNPACAVIPGKEFSDFIGAKDYQKGMLQTLTALMDSEDRRDISLKSTGARFINFPTVTIMGGSTALWLHKAMPPEAMGGGFYPRFLIISETDPKRHVALVKYSLPKAETDAAMEAMQEFHRRLQSLLQTHMQIGEMLLDEGAQHYYEEWYARRTESFSIYNEAYANRSRDQFLRIAMLCAWSCARNEMQVQDMRFAQELFGFVAKSVDSVLSPQNPELDCIKEVHAMVPCKRTEIFVRLHSRYKRREIEEAINYLTSNTAQINISGDLVTRR